MRAAIERVVFACLHNAGRSQMAAAFFNRSSDPTKARAVSAGTTPGERVHAEVAAVMAEAGIDLSGAKPQLLTSELGRGARLLVTMGCAEQCPFIPGAEVADWPLEDPKGKPLERVREIRDDVELRVLELLDARGWRRDASARAPG